MKIRISGRVFRAHKIILSRNSEFNKLFAAKPNLKEIHLSNTTSSLTDFNKKGLSSNDLDTNTKHKLLQFPAAACETFLYYLYDSTILSKYTINLDLVLIAHKFADEKLKTLCEDVLEVDVTVEDACRTLLVALETNCDLLKEIARDKMALSFLYAKFDNDFQVVSENERALAEVLRVLGNFELKKILKKSLMFN